MLVISDFLFTPINEFGHFPHPAFSCSILASISAGIGDEILFRELVFGLWGFTLTWLFKRFDKRTLFPWIAKLIAALAFGAGHLGTLVLLTGVSSPAELSPVLMAEVFLLNGFIGLIASERYVKDGLVAAAGRVFTIHMDSVYGGMDAMLKMRKIILADL